MQSLPVRNLTFKCIDFKKARICGLFYVKRLTSLRRLAIAWSMLCIYTDIMHSEIMSKMNRLRFVGTIALLISAVSANVNAQTQEDGRIWLNMSMQGKLGNTGLNWFAELQPRWREEGDQFDQLIIRPALFYKLDAKSSIWFGYLKAVSHPAGRSTFDEDRLWQQYSYTFDPLNTVTIQSRTRLEERRLETGKETGYRLRQMLKASTPLEVNPKVSLIASDELFINFNDTDWGARSGFDQNRFFLGVGYVFNPSVKVEAGYLNQYINGATVNRMNHVLSTTLSYSF